MKMTMRTAVCLLILAFGHRPCRADTVVETDFAKGDFQKLGWRVEGAWEVFTYPGAGHAFNRDGTPAYHADSAKLARERTLAFLREHIG